jgi:hypothetical protein
MKTIPELRAGFKPCAAPSHFPYTDHRSMAQVMRQERRAKDDLERRRIRRKIARGEL